MGDVMRELRLKARDNGRLPMQWDGSKNEGFKKKEKGWMRTNDDFEMWNVERQEGAGESVLGYWSDMLGLRKREKDVFSYGRVEMAGMERSGEVFAYAMSSADGGEKALVLLNFSDKKHPFGGTGFGGWRKLIAGNAMGEVGKKGVELKAYEGVIYCNW